MATNDPNRRDHATAPVGERKKNWLPWVIGGLLLLGLILLLRSCGDDDQAVVDTATTGDVAGSTEGSMANPTQPTAWNTNEFGTYLSGDEPLGRAFALERVTFASGSALLNADARAQLGEVANALKTRPSARVSLRGYADPEGDAAANQALSQQRTDAVRNALIQAGATAAQVDSSIALGETGNAAAAGNRRVEITVTAR